jgi:hypothetical protein
VERSHGYLTTIKKFSWIENAELKIYVGVRDEFARARNSLKLNLAAHASPLP